MWSHQTITSNTYYLQQSHIVRTRVFTLPYDCPIAVLPKIQSCSCHLLHPLIVPPHPRDSRFNPFLFVSIPHLTEVVAFKIPNVEIDRSVGKLLTNWDEESKMFTLQLHLKDKVEGISFADEEGSSASGSLWGEGAAGGDMDDVEQNEAAW